MNCPVCGIADNRVLWTERRQKDDRRRLECRCGIRWSTLERLERGSVTTGNGTLRPPVIPGKPPGNGTQMGQLYSENGIRSGISDPNPGSPGNPNRERARSESNAEFLRLIKVFSERWQRSNKRPYPVTAADRNQLGRFMQHNGNYIATFAEICDRYLSDRQQFTITRSGNHKLSWLVSAGLALYGGTPRETAEQYSARVKREHEARKSAARRPPANAEMRDLIAGLADGKAVGNG